MIIRFIMLLVLICSCTRNKLAPVEYYTPNTGPNQITNNEPPRDYKSYENNNEDNVVLEDEKNIYTEDEDGAISDKTNDTEHNIIVTEKKLDENKHTEQKLNNDKNENYEHSILEKKKRRRFIMPVEGGNVITKFHDKNSMGEPNKGINIAVQKGAKIVASSNGIVRYSEYGTVFGNLVIIELDEKNIVTIYGHLDEIAVTKGDKVHQGQIIGYVGKTGAVKEPQLYFAIREGKKPKDPLELINE